jgi:hypothetical protein
MRQIAFLLILFISEVNCLAGNIRADRDTLKSKKPLNLSMSYHHGYYFPHTKGLRYFTNENINGIQFEASWSFPELNKDRPPEIGFGYYTSNLGSKDVYGNVHGIYMDMGVDYLRGRYPVYIQQSIYAGVSYLTKHFDIETNPLNRAIGSPFNAFILLSLDLRADIGENLILFGGPVYVHMSNGNIQMPNFGLNLLNTRLGCSYRFNPDGKESNFQAREETEYLKNRYLILASGGIRQLSRKIPENFFVGTIVGEYSRRISLHQALGAGLDFVIDPTVGRETYVTGRRVEEIVPWHLGLHLSWERIWNNFSIILQPGYKIITLSEHYFYQYNRIGMRYRLESNIVINCSIKAQGVRADFFEFGIGYYIR